MIDDYEALSDKDESARKDRVREIVAWLLAGSKGYAVKAVNPGGVESWKWSRGLAGFDSPVSPFGVDAPHDPAGIGRSYSRTAASPSSAFALQPFGRRRQF